MRKPNNLPPMRGFVRNILVTMLLHALLMCIPAAVLIDSVWNGGRCLDLILLDH